MRLSRYCRWHRQRKKLHLPQGFADVSGSEITSKQTQHFMFFSSRCIVGPVEIDAWLARKSFHRFVVLLGYLVAVLTALCLLRVFFIILISSQNVNTFCQIIHFLIKESWSSRVFKFQLLLLSLAKFLNMISICRTCIFAGSRHKAPQAGPSKGAGAPSFRGG